MSGKWKNKADKKLHLSKQGGKFPFPVSKTCLGIPLVPMVVLAPLHLYLASKL